MQCHLKIKIHVTCTWNELLPYCSNSFNLYNVAELSRKKIGSSGIEVKSKNEKINYHDLELGPFTLFCQGQQRNVPNL